MIWYVVLFFWGIAAILLLWRYIWLAIGEKEKRELARMNIAEELLKQQCPHCGLTGGLHEEAGEVVSAPSECRLGWRSIAVVCSRCGIRM